jgi:hypothetical protein
LEFTTLMARHGPKPTAKRPNRSNVMNKLRRSAIAALAAATVTIGSLASAPTVSAMEMSCTQKYALYVAYYDAGMLFYGVGAYYQATYWWGRADQVLVGC